MALRYAHGNIRMLILFTLAAVEVTFVAVLTVAVTSYVMVAVAGAVSTSVFAIINDLVPAVASCTANVRISSTSASRYVLKSTSKS